MIKRAIYSIPNIGLCSIDYQDEVLVGLLLNPNSSSVDVCERTEFSDTVFQQVLEYLAGRRKEFNVATDISSLSPFHQNVLKELQAIPYGEVRTYKQVAESMGKPQASRAVGGACNRNPIHIIIPCHRIIGAKGALTGYAAGLEIKSQLLHLENVRK